MIRRGQRVYVVSIPWDSASVDSSHVFKNYADAKKYLAYREANGYHGYTGGLTVEEVTIQ